VVSGDLCGYCGNCPHDHSGYIHPWTSRADRLRLLESTTCDEAREEAVSLRMQWGMEASD